MALSGTITVTSREKFEFIDITSALQREVSRLGGEASLLVVYNPHTTAGLTINEGADPAVQSDIIGVLRQIVPDDYPFRHLEGNSPSHVMASLMGSSVTVLLDGNRLQLGTWQRIFFCEFDGPRSRTVSWKIV